MALSPRDQTDFVRFGGKVSDAPAPTNTTQIANAAEAAMLRHRGKDALAMCGIDVQNVAALAVTPDGVRAVRGAYAAIRNRLSGGMSLRERMAAEDFAFEALAGKRGTAAEILAALGALKTRPDGTRILNA